MQDSRSIVEFLKLGRWFGGLAPALQELIVQRAMVAGITAGAVKG